MIAIKSGDVLTFSVEHLQVSTLVASGIRLITGNSGVHVGIVIGVNANGNISWVDTNPSVAMQFHSNSLEELKAGIGPLKLQAVSSLAGKLIIPVPAREYTIAAYALATTAQSKRYSYPTIASIMIDHGARRFSPSLRKPKVWIPPSGFVCSTLVARIIEDAAAIYYPDWNNGIPLLTFEPDDFKAYPFQVDYAV